MTEKHKRRKRKINLNSLSKEQVDSLSSDLGKEVAKIMDKANKECNKMLNIYGLQSQIGYEIKEVEKTK